jgi:hypothetical protein
LVCACTGLGAHHANATASSPHMPLLMMLLIRFPCVLIRFIPMIEF